VLGFYLVGRIAMIVKTFFEKHVGLELQAVVVADILLACCGLFLRRQLLDFLRVGGYDVVLIFEVEENLVVIGQNAVELLLQFLALYVSGLELPRSSFRRGVPAVFAVAEQLDLLLQCGGLHGLLWEELVLLRVL